MINRKIKMLHKKLSRAPIKEVPNLIWMLWTMNSERSSLVRNHLKFSDEFFNPELGSPHRIYPWRLETLFSEYFISNKRITHRGSHKVLNIYHPNVTTSAINAISDIEGMQDKIIIEKPTPGIDWMKRLISQQIEWQTSLSDNYLRGCVFWLYLYDFEEMNDAYRDVSGVSYQDLLLSAIGMLSLFDRYAAIPSDISVENIPVKKEAFDRVLKFLSKDIEEFQKYQDTIFRRHKRRTREFYGTPAINHIGYRPSALRKYPLVKVGESYFAPLPPILSLRVLNGVYFDLIGNDKIKTKIAARFESYVLDMLTLVNNDFSFSAECFYLGKKNQASPDIIGTRNDKVLIVAECKAARMDNVIRFSEKPAELAKRGVGEISKRIFQIWRFIADIRKDKVEDYKKVDNQAIGLIVMIDDWTSSYPSFIQKVFDNAKKLTLDHNAKHFDRKIENEDMIGIRFADISSLEVVCRRLENQNFIDFLHFSISDRYQEYILDNVISDFGKTQTLKNTMRAHPMKNFFSDYLSRLNIHR